MISALRDADFKPTDFVKLICVDGAITHVVEGRFVTAIAALRQAAIPGCLWVTVLGRNGVINHLARGKLTIVTTRLERWGLHQSGKGEIYAKSAFGRAIPFIISPDFEIGEEQLKETAGRQDVEPTLAHTSRLQALCCRNWRSAIRKRDFDGARRIMASKKQTNEKRPPPLEARAALAPPPPLPPSGDAALNILSYVPMPADLLHVKGIYSVERLDALAQVVAHKEGDLTVLHVILHEGSELDVSASEWYAEDGPHDLFEKRPTPTHEKCTTDKKKLEELKKHA